MTENRDPAELAGAYALDALSAEEKAEYERHLASSADARRESESLGETAALLGFDAEPVQPSAALRASVLDAIASTPQLPRVEASVTDAEAPVTDAEAPVTDAAGPAASQAPVAATEEGTPTAQPVRPTSVPAAPTTKAATSRPASGNAERKASRRWYTQPLTAAVAAAALVAVLLGVNGLTSAFNNGNGLPEALQLAHINAQPDAQRETVKLTNVNDDQRVVATLVWSGELGQSALVVDGLASLSDEQIYELWYIGEDGATSAGTFNTTGTGDSWRILEGTMEAGDAVGVTVEPAGGSEQPTTDPLIVVHTA